MKSKSFYQLVRRYEAEAKQHPKRFHRRVQRQIWLGYAYIIFVAIVSILVAVLLAWATYLTFNLILLLFFIVVAFITVDLFLSLFEKISTPAGVRLDPQQCPTLFQEIDSLRNEMDIPAIDDVLLTYDLNASAGEFRSRFFVGRKNRFVAIGLPMLKSLNVEEVRSVIAHEIAHLARGHSRLSATVWHLRKMWMKLLYPEAGSVPIWWRWFAKFYGSYFEAMANVISREYEFEADRIAFNSVSRQAIITSHLWDALFKQTVEVEHLEQLERHVVQHAKPIDNVLQSFLLRLEQTPQRDHSLPYLRRTLAKETLIYESHPSCKDRIACAGFPTDQSLHESAEYAWQMLQSRSRDNAINHYLGNQFPTLLDQLESLWQWRNEAEWQVQHLQFEQAKLELQQIQQNSKDGSVGEHERVNHANLVAVLEGADAGYQAFQDVLAEYPENEIALFWCGNYNYEFAVDLPKAESYFLRALDADIRYEAEISHRMVSVCRELEKYDEAESWLEHSFGASDAIQKSQQERTTIVVNDKFIAHQLPDDRRQLIVEQLSKDPRVKRIWAARKQIEYYSEKPIYVFGIQIHQKWYKFYSDQFYDRIFQQLLQTIHFPDDYLMVMLYGQNKPFLKKFKKLSRQDACIYDNS